MIAYVAVGADDTTKAERFYSAFLLSLGNLPLFNGVHP